MLGSKWTSPLLTGLVLSIGASAHPGPHHETHEYIPARASDSRSPCPALNALANQGYIPRDGRNIVPSQLEEAMIEVFSFDMQPFLAELNQSLIHSTTGNSSTFNLHDSAVHNVIEIDGSLSRKDLYFGDDIHFSKKIWEQTASRFHGNLITIQTAAEARAYRYAKDAKTNPTFTTNDTLLGTSNGTSALYLLTLGGVNVTQVRKDWAESFFRDRLPTHLGWTKPTSRITVLDIAAVIGKIAAVPVADAIAAASMK